MSGPLEGIRVIECGGYLSAPSACYILGDLGAEVIKVEDRIKGDPTRGVASLFGRSMSVGDDINILFETANRNKKSMTLDLKKQGGKELLYKLVEKADVFCTNYSPSAVEKLDMEYETLKKHNPKIVYGIANGYGTLGPDGRKRAFDTVAQARSGIMYAVGEPESPPAQIAGPIFDQMTGTLLANGIMAALIAREKQGIGQKVDVSLLGSGLHLLAYNVNTVLFRGRPMPRPDRTNQRNSMANHYKCSDGKWILFAEAQSDRFWPDFCTTIEREDLVTDPRSDSVKSRNKNRKEVIEILDSVFITKTREEWLKLFDEKGNGLACSPVLEPEEVQYDPQVIANEYITTIDHPSIGEAKVIGCPTRFSETKTDLSKTAPNFGEHTEDILINSYGFTWEDIARLQDEEII